MRPLRYAWLGAVVVLGFIFLRTSLFLLSSVPTDITSTLNDAKGHKSDVARATEAGRQQLNNNILYVNKELNANLHKYIKNVIHDDTKVMENHVDDMEELLRHMNKEFMCNDVMKRPMRDQIHRRNTDWQIYDLDGVKNHLLVYSAYYDDRPDVGYLPVVRILGVANSEHDPFFCQIWYEGLKIPYITPVEVIKSGRGDRFDGIRYGQHLYTCKLTTAYPRPTHVSMTTKLCETSSIMLPIIWPIRSSWQQDFAICVPIAFGNFNALDLVEWFEMSKIMGVSHVHVYNASMSPDLNKVFDHYQQTGYLKVHAMSPPVNHFNKMGSKLASPASLNDCMLRYMYTYRYILFIDFDEIIVPVNSQNYSHLLTNINRHHKLSKSWISYSFRNIYHFLDMPGDPKEKEYTKFLKYRSSAEPSGFLYAAKSMIDPKSCVSVFNHYCYIRFPSPPKPFTIDVDIKLAMSHHYRHCNLGKVKCEEMYKKSHKDASLVRFERGLRDKVAAVIPWVT